MGVALYVEGYEKKPEVISGHIKLLGWFEVDKDKIEKFRIPNASTVIHDEIESFKLAESLFYNNGLEQAGDCAFYYNLMNPMSGFRFRNEDDTTYSLMFDGHRLLLLVDKILENLTSLHFEDNDPNEEKENLEKIQKVLKITANNNGLVGMMWG